MWYIYKRLNILHIDKCKLFQLVIIPVTNDYTNLSVVDSVITKDNPAFSMINDSDEEVVYGSDEESRRPLNRSHNDDDSD